MAKGVRVLACVVAACASMVDDARADGRIHFDDYTNLGWQDYMTICADLRADCEGDLCGCALAGRRRKNPSRGNTVGTGWPNAKSECLEPEGAAPDGQIEKCCEWKDSSARGGTVNGCTCREHWMAGEATCPNAVPQHGCDMTIPCDGQPGTPGISWCLIDEALSDACDGAGDNWDYCVPTNARSFTAACDLQSDQIGCRAAGCTWDIDEEVCEPAGTCVDRPHMWKYGLEYDEEEDEYVGKDKTGGAVRTSVGGASSVVLLLVLILAASSGQ